MTTEHKGAVTFKGQPLTLVGELSKNGQIAPEVELLDNNLNPIKLSSFKGKVCIICTVPSLDTPVCDMETRRFNEAASKLGPDVRILTVSMDLPFAQKRWCGAANITHVTTLSDHLSANFGKNFGVLIKELRLLARAVFIIDQKGVIRFTHLVKEVTEQPDYNTILKETEKLTHASTSSH